jgi:hypothetical protein
MTNLKCPKGHDVYNNDPEDDDLAWHKDKPYKYMSCNKCNRPYFEMDCIQSLGNSEQLKNEQSSNPRQLENDQDGWIDFEKQLPKPGQKIILRYIGSYGYQPNHEAIFQKEWLTITGISPIHIRFRWKPADHIHQEENMVEPCNNIPAEIKGSNYCLTHKQLNCDKTSKEEHEKLTMKHAQVDNKSNKVDKEPEKTCQSHPGYNCHLDPDLNCTNQPKQYVPNKNPDCKPYPTRKMVESKHTCIDMVIEALEKTLNKEWYKTTEGTKTFTPFDFVTVLLGQLKELKDK